MGLNVGTSVFQVVVKLEVKVELGVGCTELVGKFVGSGFRVRVGGNVLVGANVVGPKVDVVLVPEVGSEVRVGDIVLVG